MLTFVTSSKSLLPCQVTHLLILQMKMWTCLGVLILPITVTKSDSADRLPVIWNVLCALEFSCLWDDRKETWPSFQIDHLQKSGGTNFVVPTIFGDNFPSFCESLFYFLNLCV